MSFCKSIKLPPPSSCKCATGSHGAMARNQNHNRPFEAHDAIGLCITLFCGLDVIVPSTSGPIENIARIQIYKKGNDLVRQGVDQSAFVDLGRLIRKLSMCFFYRSHLWLHSIIFINLRFFMS